MYLSLVIYLICFSISGVFRDQFPIVVVDCLLAGPSLLVLTSTDF